MNLKNLLPAALAGLIGVGIPACKPAQEKHSQDVKRILDAVQPTEEKVSHAQSYYESRNDLKNLSSDQRMSLTLWNARLSVLKEQMKGWKISTQDLLTILKSNDKIITDANTKLKIATNFWRDIEFLSYVGDDLQLRTESYSPDKILRNFATEMKMEGGELTVSFSWTEFETKAREDKEQLSASTDVIEKWPATYTISIGLVLAK